MTRTNVDRRSLAQATLWSAPLVLASSTLPAYAASNPRTPTLDVQHGIFVTTQYNGGFVGYQGANDSTGHPTTPAAYFNSLPNTPEADINWNDATNRPANNSFYTNGEGSFTPATNGQSANPGTYLTSTGFWFSVPTTNLVSGTDYVAESVATLEKGASFSTVVEFVVPASATQTINNVKINRIVWNRQLSGRLGDINASGDSVYLQTAGIAGDWVAEKPTITQQADGSLRFRSTITFVTSKALTLTQKEQKYYAQAMILPATIELNPAQGWESFSLTSSVTSATVTYSAPGYNSQVKVIAGDTVTSTINP